MLEEFRQAPLCMDLDLDTYEGDWSHVARFYGLPILNTHFYDPAPGFGAYHSLVYGLQPA